MVDKQDKTTHFELSFMCSVNTTECCELLSMDDAMPDEGHHVADIRITCTLVLTAESRV